MTTLSATELASRLPAILDQVEQGHEEVVITRNDQPIARLVPDTRTVTALEAFSDIAGMLTPEEGEAWLRDMEDLDRPLSEELKDPWES